MLVFPSSLGVVVGGQSYSSFLASTVALVTAQCRLESPDPDKRSWVGELPVSARACL